MSYFLFNACNIPWCFRLYFFKMPKQGWTRRMTRDLRKCAEVAKEKEGEVGLLFCSILEAEWKKLHPRTKFDQHRLKRKYENLQDEDITDQQVEKASETEGKQKCRDGVIKMVDKKDDLNLKTNWTPKMLEDLKKCKEIALEVKETMKEKNVNISYMKIMHKEWLKLYPSSTLSAKNLQTRLFANQKQKKTAKNKKEPIKWTPEMLSDLEKCYNKALKVQEDMKNHDSGVSYRNVMLKEWLKLYPESTLTKDNLQARMWQCQKDKSTNSKIKGSDGSHADDSSVENTATCTATTEGTCKPCDDRQKDELKSLNNLANPLTCPKGCDKEKAKKKWLLEHANMPQDQGMLYSMRLLGQRHSAKPLFVGICYN